MIGGALPVAVQDQPNPSGDKTFASLDADSDGKLTAAEFGKLYEMEGKKATDQEKQNEFKAWDADGDGSVSKAEFSASYGAAPPQHPERIEHPDQAERPISNLRVCALVSTARGCLSFGRAVSPA